MSIENSKAQREELLKIIDSICERGYSFDFSLDSSAGQISVKFVKDFDVDACDNQ